LVVLSGTISSCALHWKLRPAAPAEDDDDDDGVETGWNDAGLLEAPVAVAVMPRGAMPSGEDTGLVIVLDNTTM
jgi:hypothetical protein